MSFLLSSSWDAGEVVVLRRSLGEMAVLGANGGDAAMEAGHLQAGARHSGGLRRAGNRDVGEEIVGEEIGARREGNPVRASLFRFTEPDRARRFVLYGVGSKIYL